MLFVGLFRTDRARDYEFWSVLWQGQGPPADFELVAAYNLLTDLRVFVFKAESIGSIRWLDRLNMVGSSSRTCEPPPPFTMSFRNVSPAARRRATSLEECHHEAEQPDNDRREQGVHQRGHARGDTFIWAARLALHHRVRLVRPLLEGASVRLPAVVAEYPQHECAKRPPGATLAVAGHLLVRRDAPRLQQLP